MLAIPAAWSQQVSSLSEAKAQYLIEVTKHINWPNEDELDRFRVAVLEHDPATKAAFEEREAVEVRGKPFEFSFIVHGDFELDDYTHVFIGHRFRGMNADLFDRSQTTLLMVDGRVDREQMMLSLMSRRQRIALSMNRENLIKRGFEPSISLLEFAGTKEDLTEELRESEGRLIALEEEVSSKEERVAELNLALEANSDELRSATAELERNRGELAAAREALARLSQQIEQARTEAVRYRREAEEQQTLFERKQHEVLARTRAMEELEAEIAKNQQVLDRQISEINAQRAMLEDKSKTIGAQRDQLFTVQAALLVFFILAFFLHRLNTQKIRANRELAELNEQLYELATIDGMTGLFNRRHFMETAQMEFRHQQRMENESTLLMMDIDHFKRINDTFGHAAGDQVIEYVGKALHKNLREYDIVGRLGGEEYAMMLVDCDLARSVEIAERLCADFAAAEIPFAQTTLRITMSIGIGQIRKEDDDIEQALLRADKALYAAKARGRNRVVVFAPEMEGLDHTSAVASR
ncbi:MAG: YfiR/HmsC family protein [Xanthomonadales bacterium]|nr:YfiR/HmsC family protein [Xanthomonadales bacterium]